MDNRGYKILFFLFLIISTVLSISLIFSRSHNKELKAENKELQKQIEEAEQRIRERTVVIDGLKTRLEYWNKIIDNDITENDINGLSGDIDDNIEFLSKFLYAADSLGK